MTTYTLQRVVYRGEGAPVQLVVLKAGGTLDARENYFGVYPDVLSALSLSSPSVADIQGFVGVPFDDDFDTGPYFGGRTIAEPVQWSGVVYVSGDVITTGSLTVLPGTEIRVAPVDQDRNAVGDYSIAAHGPTLIVGSEDEPITFRADTDERGAYLWHLLNLRGADSELRWARIEDAGFGLVTQAPGLQVSDTLFTGNRYGVEVAGGAPGFQRVVISDNSDDGLRLRQDATFDVARIERNGARGVNILGGSSALTDVRIAENASYGLEVLSAGNTLAFVDISDNVDQGIYVHGAGGAEVTDCVITFNGGAGALLKSDFDAHPTATLNRCNVFGNASVEGAAGGFTFTQASLNLRARDNTSSSATSDTSAVYNSPQPVYEARVNFAITGGRGEGRLQTGGGQSIVTISRSETRWLAVDTPTLRVFANETDCCGVSTMTLQVARGRTPGIMQQELSVGIFAAGRVDARNNYWGVFPDVQARIHEGQVGSTDFTGFQPFALEDVGPRALP